MSSKRPSGRKRRVDFRPNRQQPRRTSDWTQRFHRDHEDLLDARQVESVRAKGELSRKRTVIVDERDAPIVDQSLWRPGTVAAVFGLIAEVSDAAGQTWVCTIRRVLRTLLIERRSAVTVGDRVWFSDQSQYADGQPAGVIERIEPRSSSLSRRDRRGREHTLVANADELLIVASVAEPRLKPHLIDRYLVAAGKGNLRPVICFNKCDLADEGVDLEADSGAEAESERAHADAHRDAESDDDEVAVAGRPTVAEVLNDYRRLGYTCIRTSASTGLGIDDLRRELAGHITVLSGQSGVGKSSLINAVQPGLDLAVDAVSEESEKGRHTTSHARLLRLDVGGFVVDTPGIRQFDLWTVEPGELELYFVEIAPLVQQCRFRNCGHLGEAGCAVIAAVDDGRISRRRYASYGKMYEELLRGA
jgi:ribosome biogenesis GTPase